MADQPTHDCGHACCDEPHDPFHDHFLSVEACPSCQRLRDLEAAADDLTARMDAAEGRP